MSWVGGAGRPADILLQEHDDFWRSSPAGTTPALISKFWTGPWGKDQLGRSQPLQTDCLRVGRALSPAFKMWECPASKPSNGHNFRAGLILVWPLPQQCSGSYSAPTSLQNPRGAPKVWDGPSLSFPPPEGCHASRRTCIQFLLDVCHLLSIALWTTHPQLKHMPDSERANLLRLSIGRLAQPHESLDSPKLFLSFDLSFLKCWLGGFFANFSLQTSFNV